MKELVYTHRSTREVSSILDPTNLRTPDDLTDALEELSLKITQSCSNIVEITKDICTAPNFFEIVLSGKPPTPTQIATILTTIRFGPACCRQNSAGAQAFVP